MSKTVDTRSVFGAVLGAIVGFVVAINIVIFSGTDDGYQTSPGELIDQYPAVALVAVLGFLGCISAGITLARR